MEIEANFFGDWIKHMRVVLTDMGHKVNASATATDVSFMFFNVAARLVESRPRRVHEASMLECPADEAKGYASLRGKIERGDNLQPHLSTRITRAKFNDGMLNDWGLQHLHLGETLDGRGFIARTDAVLIALFQPDDCYCIAVMPHDNWSNVELLKTLQAEWPHLLEPLLMPGIPPKVGPTAAEISEARACGITPLVSINGKVYTPMGGGITTSKLGADVVRSADHYAERVRDCERWVRENIGAIDDQLFGKTGRRLSSPVRLELVIENGGKAFAVSHEHQLSVELGTL